MDDAMSLLRAGEFITCAGEGGHLIAEVLRPIERGQRGWANCVGAWRIDDPPQVGSWAPLLCPWCRAPYFRITDRRGAQFHIEGRGWT